jgi:4-alpha-glucanotransferase
VRHRWHDTSPATQRAVAAAMEAEGPPPRPGDSPVKVVRGGHPAHVGGPYELILEDGSTLRGDGRLPADLPLGYHDLVRPHRDQPVRLIVSPRRCYLPPGLQAWGWAVQLYALRSEASWGMGDLADLADLARWSARLGAGMLLVNPLHAARPEEPSPYFPSSRCWRNPLYLRVEDIPGMAGHPGLPGLVEAGRALNGGRRIDRAAVWRLKRQALEWAWDRFEERDEFAKWRSSHGPALSGYARFATLAEARGDPWPHWPEPLRRPDGSGVEAALAGREREVGFQAWIQWLLDGQLARAGEEVGLVSDLAIGVDPAGADAWVWQDALALGARVGAPPDDFNAEGQDWGLPPFNPWKLRQERFEPFIRTVRAGLAHSGGLRVDHVMGLFRLWWIPPGASPAEGAYVRYPQRELLDILALESVRAGAYVIGEDLGTVEPAVRKELARRRVLSYRLMWFEPEPPGPSWPARALAAVTTHDLPTVAGLWTGRDLEEQQALGLPVDPGAAAAMREKVGTWLEVGPGAPVEEVVAGVHRLLAKAPSVLVAATLEDALAVPERPNIPATTGAQRPNWSLALPSTLEQIKADPLVAQVAGALRSPRRSSRRR